MFEKALPEFRSQPGDAALDDLSHDMIIGSPVGGRCGEALRAIEWSELTARLNAARDLRRVLRRDARASIQNAAASFGDAAATYFQSLGDGERPVNPVALEASKASRRNDSRIENNAPNGDARDE